MTKFFGARVGTPKQSTRPVQISSQLERGSDHVLCRDDLTFAAAQIADTFQIAVLPWETVIAPGSTLYFAALGAGTTLEIGDVTSSVALAAATATNAAGSMLMTKAKTPAHYFDPLWKLLGYADLPTAKAVGPFAEILGTLRGGAATGEIAWNLVGQAR